MSRALRLALAHFRLLSEWPVRVEREQMGQMGQMEPAKSEFQVEPGHRKAAKS